MKTRLVVISGLCYTGSSSLAKHLSLALTWELIYAGERFRKYASANRIDPNVAMDIPADIHRIFDDKLTQEMQKAKNIVAEGRIAVWLARNITDAFKIWCQVDLETRIERCIQRETLSAVNARILVHDRDQNDNKTFMSLYGLQLQELSGTALIVDTSLPPEENCRRIITLLQSI